MATTATSRYEMNAFWRCLVRYAPGLVFMSALTPTYYPEQEPADDDLPPGHPERLCRRPLDRAERRIWAHLADLDRSGGQAKGD